jgi:hypothetical protein
MTSHRVSPIGPVILLAAAIVLAAPGCGERAASCAACGRQECRNMTVTLVRQDGSRQQTCCARCGAHVAASGPAVVSMTVRDFETAQSVDVSRAIFVEGSDVHPCRGITTDPPRTERGCCVRSEFDRCEPSLIAFGSRAHAEAFAREHGGNLKSFADLHIALAAGGS